jgi:ABC-type maltose transport system permease subunit
MTKTTAIEPLKVSTPWHGQSRTFYRSQRILGRSIVYLLLLGGAILFLIPFVWMLSTSFKESKQVYVWPPVWIPDPIVPENYSRAWNLLPFTQFYWNTIRITFLSILEQSSRVRWPRMALPACAFAGVIFCLSFCSPR